MDYTNLESIETKIGRYLAEKRSEYKFLLKTKKEKLTEIKLKEINDIITKTYNIEKNTEIKKIKESLISNIPVSIFIDENVLIGNRILELISPKLQDSQIITSKEIFTDFKNYFKEENIIAIDNLNGEALKDIISDVNNNDFKFLIGIGGGRVMDILKYIMMKTNKYCVAIPSSLATHVYTSPKITISPALAELGEIVTIDSPVPNIVIIDINFLSNLQETNPRLIRAGLGDMMACITALEDWKLAEQYQTTKVNHAIIDMINLIIERLSKIDVEKPLKDWVEDYIFLQTLLCRISGWAGSAPVSGSEHLFAIAAENNFSNPPLHGELVALGAIIMTYIQEKSYKQVSQLARKLKLPISLSEIGISIEQVIDALQNTKKIARKKGRFTIINKLNMDKKYCYNVINTLLKEGSIRK